MNLKWPIASQWKSAAICAGATVLLGFLCLTIVPARFWFERLSYDLPFMFAPEISADDVVVVERDETSYRELNQQYDRLWDRSLYARLLNERLTPDRAKLAVFDVFLSDPGDSDQNEKLARAIQDNGRVVLAMDYRWFAQLKGGEPIFPQPEFKDAALALGVVSALADKADGVVRQIHPGFEQFPSLAWAAAAQSGMNSNALANRFRSARWLNYGVSLQHVHRISFADALRQEPGYFTNKIVFIGGSPQIKLEDQPADVFATPARRWGGEPQPGVVIQALTFLNLIRGCWLTHIAPAIEMPLILLLGALAAVSFSLIRPWLGAVIALAMVVILFAGECALTAWAHQWFSWMIVAVAEIPFALGWSAFVQDRKLAREKELIASELVLERQAVERLLPPTESEAPTIRSDAADAAPGVGPAGTMVVQPAKQPAIVLSGKMPRILPPSVPDHTLVRCIGEGGYGQVWLARDVIGTFHAVKFVYRKSFDSAVPFDREFKGIHHFTPISRMHPGFVHILHVGRNEKAEYFFYIMELADDETSGQTVAPETYTAKTLSRVIRKRGRMPPAECVTLGVQLSSALQFLHQHRLIHRDIKPSNVLYVHGQAKFADVGLVTEINTHRGETTYIGTEGYIAPEGPGTTAADVYSLGKVLYEASMGMDRMRFPELPTSLVEKADPLVSQLNQIVLKACEFDPAKRYQSAQELHDDLQTLAKLQGAV